MSTSLTKILSITLYSIIGISTLLGILFYSDAISESVLMYWCYLLLAVAALAAIVFPIIGMTQNPKGAKSALIGLGAMILVFVLAYVLAGDEIVPAYEGFIDSPAQSKMVSAGLIAFYILAIGAILATIYSSISRVTK